ncbi:hypothetical protein AC578_3 [Pseudocercospora eumusae]|uniref:Uncharacterized protein n=1 Tax=Pseudocercospora eumusae TaxID=321146 RepID=A0A139GUT4_9PEZI|nr:hypothetical protein AC578_3 [Pseudocercospora eumusae]
MAKTRSSTGRLKTRNGTYNRPADNQPPPPKKRKRTQTDQQSAADAVPHTSVEKPPQSTAAAHVFHVYELVERILLKLDPKNVENAMRASKYIRSVAEQSQPLIHHIAGPTPPGLEVIWKVREATSIEAILAPMTIHIALTPWSRNNFPYPLDTPFYITPLVFNEKLLQLVPWIEKYRINLSNNSLVRLPESEKATPGQSAFVCLSQAVRDNWTWPPKLPGISSLGEEALDMFFTNPPAATLEVRVWLPGRMHQAHVGQTAGWRFFGGPRSKTFRIVREGGVKLNDVVAVVEKAGSEWIAQLRSGGFSVKFDGEKVVLVTKEIFDFVKGQGSVRLLEDGTVGGQDESKT